MAAGPAEEGPREHCSACGFDSDLYDRADTISSQAALPALLTAAAEGLDIDALTERPSASTWSILEYLDHVREVVFGNRMAIEMGRQEPGIDLGDPPEAGISSHPSRLEPGRTLGELSAEYRNMQALLSSLADHEWTTSVRLGGRRHSLGWFGRHVLHDGLHHLVDIGRIRSGRGLGAPHDVGTVRALHRSGGGVPKHSVASVTITARGVAGDVQADRRHHAITVDDRVVVEPPDRT